MKKGSAILVIGLLVAAGAFAGFYYAGTARCREMMRQPSPELAWLKEEFKLNDAEYARIVQLHEAYMPKCMERCRGIEELNTKLQRLLSGSAAVTPEIQAVLAERAKMRADCEGEMLQHFLEVSRTMAPEQGHRYLEWVQAQCSLRGAGMEQRHRVNTDGHVGMSGTQHM